MADRTQVCNLQIRIEETLSLPKGRGVITENILLLKYQKQTITAVLNGEDAFMLLPTTLTKVTKYYPSLSFGTLRRSGIKFPIGILLEWIANNEFYSRLVNLILNQSDMQTNFSAN